jgi:Flp pilus assembly protein TadG
MKRYRRRLTGERGTALLEAAMTLPLLLLVSVSIFEFGRAFQTSQILTNAAREGARLAVMPGGTTGDVEKRVHDYMKAGQLQYESTASVVVNPNALVNIGAGTAKASLVTVTYPFQFMVLQRVVNLVVKGSMVGTPMNMVASAEMRNESQ